MEKLNIKAVSPQTLGLVVLGGRCGGAWMSCAAALNVVPPGHCATRNHQQATKNQQQPTRNQPQATKSQQQPTWKK